MEPSVLLGQIISKSKSKSKRKNKYNWMETLRRKKGKIKQRREGEEQD